MHLRSFASLHFCFKTAVGAALLAFALQPAVHAQSRKTITQADLQARLHEAQANPELEQKLYGLGKKVAAVCVNCHGDQNGKGMLEVPCLDGQKPA